MIKITEVFKYELFKTKINFQNELFSINWFISNFIALLVKKKQQVK